MAIERSTRNRRPRRLASHAVVLATTVAAIAALVAFRKDLLPVFAAVVTLWCCGVALVALRIQLQQERRRDQVWEAFERELWWYAEHHGPQRQRPDARG